MSSSPVAGPEASTGLKLNTPVIVTVDGEVCAISGWVADYDQRFSLIVFTLPLVLVVWYPKNLRVPQNAQFPASLLTVTV